MDPLYDTTFLAGVIAPLRKSVPFILNMFFANYVGPTGQSKITFDQEGEVLGVAPMVYPLVAGKPVKERGYSTTEFAPAYVKPFMALDPERPLHRQLGERLSGELTPQQREDARITLSFKDLKTISDRRVHLMAIEAMKTGKVTVTGEGYDEPKLVDYQRKSEHTKLLTLTDRWGESEVSPVDNVEDYCQDIAEESGVYPDVIAFDKHAFRLFRKDPQYKDLIDRDFRGAESSMELLLAADQQEGVLIGRLGANGPEIWVFNAVYKDDQGVLQRLVPDYSVMIGSRRPEASGTRYFGDVIDADVGYQHTEFKDPETGLVLPHMAKTWTTKNPGQRYCMLQCAPLPVLTRPNATMFVQVR